MFAIKKLGFTRIVILIGSIAIKIPRIDYKWKPFLRGLLGNCHENDLFKVLPHEKLCPVLYCFPGGFFSIMRRALPLTENEFSQITKDWNYIPGIKFKHICFEIDEKLPVEIKKDSFGWLDGKIVAVDYGT